MDPLRLPPVKASYDAERNQTVADRRLGELDDLDFRGALDRRGEQTDPLNPPLRRWPMTPLKQLVSDERDRDGRPDLDHDTTTTTADSSTR